MIFSYDAKQVPEYKKMIWTACDIWPKMSRFSPKKPFFVKRTHFRVHLLTLEFFKNLEAVVFDFVDYIMKKFLKLIKLYFLTIKPKEAFNDYWEIFRYIYYRLHVSAF